MAKPIIIALDGMGGDDAPDVIVEGASIAATKLPDVNFLLFGQEEVLEPLLKPYPNLEGRLRLIHTDDVIKSEDKPSQAMRRGRKSSMGLAIQAVKGGDADVAVSAGNTGALMALSKIMLRMLPGIDRPALSSLVPTVKDDCIMLDLGANVECSAENLVQFAIMGAAKARVVLGLDNPRVGLVNIGTEELKGHDTIRMADQILKVSSIPMDYMGFVESDGLGKGNVDVFVFDGFTGNVAIKAIEGVAKMIGTLLKESFSSSMLSKGGYLLAKSGLNHLKNHMDPNNHNGAILLGLNGLVVKSHGSTTAEGFYAAIKVANDTAQQDLCNLISQDLENFGDEHSKDLEEEPK